MIWLLLLRNLALTLAFELAGAWGIFRIRERDALVVIALAQIATNPLVNLGALYLPQLIGAYWPTIAALELAAAAAEAALYARAKIAWPLALSLALNALSFLIGYALL